MQLSAQDMKLASLHTYWIIADRIRITARPNASSRETVESLGEGGAATTAMVSLFMHVSVFYALVYVVIEGYRKLGEMNPELDALLSNEDNVQKLRRFRNNVFHFQHPPVSDKLWGFVVQPDSEKWVQQVHRAFEQHFLRRLPIKQYLERFAEDRHEADKEE